MRSSSAVRIQDQLEQMKRWPEEHSVPNHCVLCRHDQQRLTLPHVATQVWGGPHE